MAPVDRPALRELLQAARIWGAEIDIRFRVLALTIEPVPEAHPTPDAADPRLQLLLYPVSAVGASLVERTDHGPVVRQFGEEALPDVVALFDGATSTSDPLAERPADLDLLAPRLSMRGHATVGDGILHHLHLHLVEGDLELDLWASFDEVEVRGPEQAGDPLPH